MNYCMERKNRVSVLDLSMLLQKKQRHIGYSVRNRLDLIFIVSWLQEILWSRDKARKEKDTLISLRWQAARAAKSNSAIRGQPPGAKLTQWPALRADLSQWLWLDVYLTETWTDMLQRHGIDSHSRFAGAWPSWVRFRLSTHMGR